MKNSPSSGLLTDTVNKELQHKLNEPARKCVRTFLFVINKKALSDTLDHLKSWGRSLITARTHTGGFTPRRSLMAVKRKRLQGYETLNSFGGDGLLSLCTVSHVTGASGVINSC